MLARIWAEVLGVERVGVDDNFFALGGDSILSLQVVSAGAGSGALRVTPRQVFQYPTIGGAGGGGGQGVVGAGGARGGDGGGAADADSAVVFRAGSWRSRSTSIRRCWSVVASAARARASCEQVVGAPAAPPRRAEAAFPRGQPDGWEQEVTGWAERGRRGVRARGGWWAARRPTRAGVRLERVAARVRPVCI